MAELEAAISLKKEMKSHIEKEFEKPENIASAEKMKELNADYQKVFKELDTLEVDFENVFSEMMENE
jgi:uncharacterized protein YpuA (DUF1002 family)